MTNHDAHLGAGTRRRIFILEDDPDRVRYFREQLGLLFDLTIVDSCAQADHFQPPYCAIFLDHDLGGRQLDRTHEDNGAAFAVLIGDRLTRSDSVIVHSYNAYGALRMLGVLGRGMYAPFRGGDFDQVIRNLVEEAHGDHHAG